MFSIATSHGARPTRTMATLRWLNAGLLVLAACRALVPGLCTTQLAAQDAAACRAAHSCCQASADSSVPAARPPLPERGPCGLCSLMHGMLDPLGHSVLEPPCAHAQGPARSAAHAPEKAAIERHRGRAPPGAC